MIGLWLARGEPAAPGVDESFVTRELVASGAGYAIGVCLGVHGASRLLGRRGSLLGVVVGCLLGGMISLLVVFGARRFRLPVSMLTFWLMGGSLAGAIVGSHVSAWGRSARRAEEGEDA